MNEVSSPLLLFPRNLGDWHRHLHVYQHSPNHPVTFYITSCWKAECWHAECVIKQTMADLDLLTDMQYVFNGE